ncbi:DNA topoisomerase III [Anaerobacillus isosaccharinicus]|uniref:DNA topoisomerase n=1 Tax=Anaerobacillus isosaccharinicus TaxID=1532552 RepID=A0A1S2L7T2_9BACI|nr:DNA topoisomerase III [Anaerobacillus isosaccharinicus]MBA5587664.1 DNA topoisomerase III [Anaerobacillus isosaccharinicus]QOY34164.1 DNA topoisomerase III [Anaerobacillus isosaccharinicus]
MKLLIAEKPDQGIALVSQFKTKKQDGFIIIEPNKWFPNGGYCTWAVGHVLQLVPPESYNPAWKKWMIGNLPMIPDKFQYEVVKAKNKQYQIINKLLKNKDVTEIIHGGDAGREGELIIRSVIQKSGVKKPMKRLWISSLTPKAILEGFDQLLDEEKTRSLYYEAYTRACADWLVGMNASRVYSILLKEKGISDVFSAGRVQTPTLALIVKREKEIEQFESKAFWEVIASFSMDGKEYEGKWENENNSRIEQEALAKKIAEFCTAKPAEVFQADKDRKKFEPPLLFNLSALQATANSIYKFSPQKTLDLLQQLYQKGIVSYPRSDSNYVTEGEAQTFPLILQKLSNFTQYAEFFPTPINSLLNNKRYVNEKKVTDHYAIIPTEQVKDPSKLAGDEAKIYDLVVRRLIAAHYPAAIFDYSTIITLVDKRAKFTSKGKQQITEGWRKVLFKQDDDQDVILPELNEGDQGEVNSVQVREGKTQPPKRYTEGQLITLMKTAGKFVDNEELEKVLNKTEGLGTEATRAGIITMLKDRNYIEVIKNKVYATKKAKILIKAVGENILASPEMTAKWEQRLGEIGQGKASPATFMEQTKKLSKQIIDNATSRAKEWDFQNLVYEVKNKPSSKFTLGKKLGKCKLCDGDVVDKGKFYGCSNYKKTSCNFTISKAILGKKITETTVTKILTDGKTNVLKGFKKGDKTFSAALIWDEKEKKVSFSFEG